MIVKTAHIDKVLKNPYRDFNNYPIDPEQIERLKESMEKGLWHPLPVRRLGDSFELAFGHHRLETLRQLGETEVRVAISEFNDDDMVRLMVQENATQRGDSVIAALDSIAAITKRLASVILRSENIDEFNKHFTGDHNRSPILEDNKAFLSTKGNIKDGRAIGRKIIMRYIGPNAFGSKQIQEAVAVLKDTGQLKDILENIAVAIGREQEAAKLEAERIEREAIERERMEKARIERERKERDRSAKERAEREIQAAKDKEAREKARAEAAERKAKADAEHRARQDKIRAAREAENKRAEAKRLEARRLKAEAEAAEFAAQEQREASVDVAAIGLFKADAHGRVFRKLMATEEALRVFPVDMHYDIAKKAIEAATNYYTPTGHFARKVELTEYGLGRVLKYFIHKGEAVKQASFNTTAEKIETAAPHLKTERLAKEARASMRIGREALAAFMADLITNPANLEKAWSDVRPLRDELVNTMGQIKELQILFNEHGGMFGAMDKTFLERDLLQLEDKARESVVNKIHKARN